MKKKGKEEKEEEEKEEKIPHMCESTGGPLPKKTKYHTFGLLQ